MDKSATSFDKWFEDTWSYVVGKNKDCMLIDNLNLFFNCCGILNSEDELSRISSNFKKDLYQCKSNISKNYVSKEKIKELVTIKLKHSSIDEEALNIIEAFSSNNEIIPSKSNIDLGKTPVNIISKLRKNDRYLTYDMFFKIENILSFCNDLNLISNSTNHLDYSFNNNMSMNKNEIIEMIKNGLCLNSNNTKIYKNNIKNLLQKTKNL